MYNHAFKNRSDTSDIRLPDFLLYAGLKEHVHCKLVQFQRLPLTPSRATYDCFNDYFHLLVIGYKTGNDLCLALSLEFLCEMQSKVSNSP